MALCVLLGFLYQLLDFYHLFAMLSKSLLSQCAVQMLDVSSVEIHSLGAGVNEVPRSSATLCSTIPVAQRDGWYETGKRAPSSLLGEQDHQEPWAEFNQVVLGSRGGASDPFDRKTNWKGKKIRRQMPVFKMEAGYRGALHLIKLRLHTTMVF